MYCKNCGQQLEDGAAFCPHCGTPQNTQAPQNTQGTTYTQNTPYTQNGQYPQNGQNTPNDSGSFGWGLLGFCIPLVGLILFLVWKDTKPKSSKVAGMGALIAVIISVVFYVLSAAAGIAMGLLG